VLNEKEKKKRKKKTPDCAQLFLFFKSLFISGRNELVGRHENVAPHT